MKVFLNNEKLDLEFDDLTLSQLLDEIKLSLDDEILKEILLNGVNVNQKYLEESLVEKEDIDELKFITQTTDSLIKETLNEIDNYLPKLKKGCLDVVELFRNNKIDKANSKLQLIFDGLGWYTQSTNSIVNLIDDKKLQKFVMDNLISLNKFLEELHKAQENEDVILVADILEYEIVELINVFTKINNKIMHKVN